MVVGIRGRVRILRLMLSLGGPEPTNELTRIENDCLEVNNNKKISFVLQLIVHSKIGWFYSPVYNWGCDVLLLKLF